MVQLGYKACTLLELDIVKGSGHCQMNTSLLITITTKVLAEYTVKLKMVEGAETGPRSCSNETSAN